MPAVRLLADAREPNDVHSAEFLGQRAEEWLRASGARTTTSLMWAQPKGPSAGQHQAGTCRMGTDPRTSVTDTWGRVWGHDGVTLADGSLHVTNGGVNPVLTILALAWRISERLAGGALATSAGARAARSARRRPPRCAPWRASSSAGSEAAAALPFACSGERAPGMTVDTASCIRIQRRASWASVASSGTSARSSSTASRPVSNGTPANVSPTSKASPWRL